MVPRVGVQNQGPSRTYPIGVGLMSPTGVRRCMSTPFVIRLRPNLFKSPRQPGCSRGFDGCDSHHRPLWTAGGFSYGPSNGGVPQRRDRRSGLPEACAGSPAKVKPISIASPVSTILSPSSLTSLQSRAILLRRTNSTGLSLSLPRSTRIAPTTSRTGRTGRSLSGNLRGLNRPHSSLSTQSNPARNWAPKADEGGREQQQLEDEGSGPQDDNHGGDLINTFGAMRLEPDFGPNNAYFPSLPKIRDPKIEEQVFTHRSYFARPTQIFEDHPNDLSPDNERYEHLGDTVLGLVVTNLLFETFPGLRVGPSTKIRALVVGNSTLADMSKRYRLPDRLRLHSAQAISLRASTNIQADVFEAFVGGLYRDQGLDAVQSWLNLLFRPFIQVAYQHVRKQHNIPPLPPSPHLANALARNGPNSRGGSAAGSGAGASPSADMDVDPSLSSRCEEDAGPGPTVGHLALFNQHLQKQNRQVEWVFSDGQEPVFTGAHLGFLTAANSNGNVVARGHTSTENHAEQAQAQEPGACGGSRVGNKENQNQNQVVGNNSNFNSYGNNGHRPSSGQPVLTPTASGLMGPLTTATAMGMGQVKWYSDPCVPAHQRIKGTQQTPVWYVKVLVDGELYGRGRGNTKKAAKNEAAKEGLVRLGIEY